MQILKESREFSKIDKYRLTVSPDRRSYKDLEDGEVLHVKGYIAFVDTNAKDEETEILSLDCDEGVIITSSDIVKRSISDIADVMEGDEFPVKKISGISKAGRKFQDCVLAVEELSDLSAEQDQ